LSSNYELVWLLWGNDAECYEEDIRNKSTHLILKCSHPSPFSANKASKGKPAFIGSNCFKMANEWLKSKGRKEIDWSIL